jgi:hypothetical protein
MDTITARALSLAVVVAIWAGISHLGRIPVQLWPVIVGLACFLAAGGGIPGLKKSIASTLSGVVCVLLYVAISKALGREEIVDALVLGAAVFAMVLQARVPLLSYTPGAIAGAGVTIGALGVRSANVERGMRVALALALGAVLGYVSEWLRARINARTA